MLWHARWPYGSVLVSGSSAPASSPGWGHCVVFLGNTRIYSRPHRLSPPRCIKLRPDGPLGSYTNYLFYFPLYVHNTYNSGILDTLQCSLEICPLGSPYIKVIKPGHLAGSRGNKRMDSWKRTIHLTCFESTQALCFTIWLNLVNAGWQLKFYAKMLR